MKLRRIQAISLGIILLLLCMTGCGRKSEDAVQQSDIEQYVSAELPEESSADRLVGGSAGDSLDTNAGEPEVESVSKPYSEMTTAEKIKTFTVEGCPLSLPCRVKDMGDGLSLGSGITVTSGTICYLMYDGKELGDVIMPEVSLTSDGVEDMSVGYENEWVTEFMLPTFKGNFYMAGVTSASTLEEIVSLWGEPDDIDGSDDGKNIYYYDYNENIDKKIAIITFYFFDETMMEVTIENTER